MRNLRRCYYNAFSRFYDQFVALHSVDAHGALREFFSEKVPVKEGDSVLDICTGTGSLLLYLRDKIGAKGLVAGVDFSRGMLKVGQEKTKTYKNISLVESDVACLPFDANAFDTVTCSHAFYELKGETQDRALRETVRVLKPGKPFLMLEHDVPKSALIRALFYIRLFSMGAKRAIHILRHERTTLEAYFENVEKLVTPNGRSKILICWNRSIPSRNETDYRAAAKSI
jgi:demethylmenaquinone methyltransferase/2-methoxy-6-polyprenyl-1,4-benzoquinol methylase